MAPNSKTRSNAPIRRVMVVGDLAVDAIRPLSRGSNKSVTMTTWAQQQHTVAHGDSAPRTPVDRTLQRLGGAGMTACALQPRNIRSSARFLHETKMCDVEASLLSWSDASVGQLAPAHLRDRTFCVDADTRALPGAVDPRSFDALVLSELHVGPSDHSTVVDLVSRFTTDRQPENAPLFVDSCDPFLVERIVEELPDTRGTLIVNRSEAIMLWKILIGEDKRAIDSAEKRAYANFMRRASGARFTRRRAQQEADEAISNAIRIPALSDSIDECLPEVLRLGYQLVHRLRRRWTVVITLGDMGSFAFWYAAARNKTRFVQAEVAAMPRWDTGVGAHFVAGWVTTALTGRGPRRCIENACLRAHAWMRLADDRLEQSPAPDELMIPLPRELTETRILSVYCHGRHNRGDWDVRIHPIEWLRAFLSWLEKKSNATPTRRAATAG